jgi:hypothetical protein
MNWPKLRENEVKREPALKVLKEVFSITSDNIEEKHFVDQN